MIVIKKVNKYICGLHRQYLAKKRIRKRGLQGFRVQDPVAMFRLFETAAIEYAVLRPPDISDTEGDFDVLIDVRKYKDIVDLLIDCHSPTGTKVDLYSVSGGKKLNYRKFPYYPPRFSSYLISQRQKNGDYYCLAPKADFLAYAFHLVYQKSLASGIETGFKEIETTSSSRKYIEKLTQKISAAGLTLDSPITLKDLVDFLDQHNLSMPYDLLCRWALNGDELQQRLEKEQRRLIGPPRWNDQYIFVFMLRENIEGSNSEKVVINEISKTMPILDDIMIPISARKELGAMTRGGNWIQIGTGKTTNPYRIIVAHDQHPEKPREADADFPLVDNVNFALKEELRNIIVENRDTKDSIHGTDNVIEAEYVMQCVDKVLRLNDSH